jgi:hypothetical protein
MPLPLPAGPRRSAGVLAVALALYAGLALAASRTKSSTFDEPIHLPPGYISLTLGDHRMNPDHPPLVRRLAALPLLLLDVKWDRAVRAADKRRFARGFAVCRPQDRRLPLRSPQQGP